MDQEPEKSEARQPEPTFFSNHPEHGNEILKSGINVLAEIITYNEEPDQQDDEHSIIKLGFSYEAGGRIIQQEIKFSINIVHISYGYSGGLYNTPKFKYSLDDFRNSMLPGQKLKVTVIEKNPDEFVMEVNEVMAEIMQYDAVWR
jgi:hypothetical protein